MGLVRDHTAKHCTWSQLNLGCHKSASLANDDPDSSGPWKTLAGSQELIPPSRALNRLHALFLGLGVHGQPPPSSWSPMAFASRSWRWYSSGSGVLPTMARLVGGYCWHWLSSAGVPSMVWWRSRVRINGTQRWRCMLFHISHMVLHWCFMLPCSLGSLGTCHMSAKPAKICERVKSIKKSMTRSNR